MAKKIKFNLIIDDQAIRSIEDLQENFNLQDLLEVYKNGLLARWLEVREYDNYLEKVKEMNLEKDIELVKKLVDIFELETSQKEVEKSVYNLEFLKKKEKELELISKKEDKWKKIIENYHQGYQRLKDNLIEKKSDMPYIKEAIREMHDKYLRLFKLNYYDFYFKFIENKVLFPILAILMNRNLRDIFLEDEEINSVIFDDIMENIEINNSIYYGAEIKKIRNRYDEEKITDKKVYILEYNKNNDSILFVKDKAGNIYTEDDIKGAVLDELIVKSNDSYNYIKYVEVNDLIAHPDAIKNNIKRFSGETDDYWKDIEPKGKRYMIISMENGNYLRNAGESKEELDYKDINGEFLILDGIDYKSNSLSDELIYLEV